MELSLRDRIRAGDPAAFAELFGAHARAVYGHAARLSADRGTAEDVVSLTFLEAWRLREKLRPEAEAPPDADASDADGLRPWLYGIATNVLRNTRRAARRHSAALARLPGRPGIGLSYGERDDRTVWVFDRNSLAFLGSTDEALLDVGVTDETGETPAA